MKEEDKDLITRRKIQQLEGEKSLHPQWKPGPTWAKMQNDLANLAKPQVPSEKPKIRALGLYLRIAASALLIMTLSYVVWKQVASYSEGAVYGQGDTKPQATQIKESGQPEQSDQLLSSEEKSRLDLVQKEKTSEESFSLKKRSRAIVKNKEALSPVPSKKVKLDISPLEEFKPSLVQEVKVVLPEEKEDLQTPTIAEDFHEMERQNKKLTLVVASNSRTRKGGLRIGGKRASKKAEIAGNEPSKKGRAQRNNGLKPEIQLNKLNAELALLKVPIK